MGHTSQVEVTNRSSMDKRRVYGFPCGGGMGGGRSSVYAGSLKYCGVFGVSMTRGGMGIRIRTSNKSAKRVVVRLHLVDGASASDYSQMKGISKRVNTEDRRKTPRIK